MIEFSLWDILRNLLQAARWTVALSLIAFIGGGLIGLGLLVARLARWRGAETVARVYVQLFQGTPLLMQLFLAYFGLALFGLNVSAWTAAALALTLYSSAYLTEIWRGCVDAVPPTVGFSVQIIKGTALASVIGFIELTKAGTMIANATFRPFTVYACVALMYFVLCFPVSWWARTLERKLHGHR